MAIVPLLVFAGATQRWGLEVVALATEVRVAREVAAVARALDQEEEAAEQTLRALAAFAPADGDALTPFVADATAVSEPRHFEYIQVLGPGGEVLSRAGAVPQDPARCDEGGWSSLARVEVPGEGATWMGGYWVGRSIGRDLDKRITVVDGEGAIVFSTSCTSAPPTLPPGAGEGGTRAGSFTMEVDGTPTQVAFAGVEGRPWTAVVQANASFMDPVERMFRTYWWFVLVLAFITFLAFSLMLKRVTSSIEDLTRAAERVGEGELRPWLPPPGGDEVGRLTLAFSKMTDRLRETLEMVDRNSRLAVMGQLSSYLAHEIRNPLSAVKMNLQRLQRWQRQGELPDRCAVPIEVSLSEVDRLSRTVSNVLQLGRAQSQDPERVSLHRLVSECSALLENEFASKGVELRLDLQPGGDEVLVRSGQIKGAIINLMLNAIEAQPEGGALSIRSRLAPGGASGRDPHIRLHFRDEGPGVPAHVRDRILEPFFTTKQQGSGIGLAVASQGVRDNGGELFLAESTELGQGAEFVITLPLAPMGSDEGDLGGRKLPPWMEHEAAEASRPALQDPAEGPDPAPTKPAP